jgi:hypothetical protein
MQSDVLNISEEAKILQQSGEDYLNNLTDSGYVERAYLVAKEHNANTVSSEPVPPGFSHKINLGTEGNPKWATIRPDQIIISVGSDPQNMTHTLLDFSNGMDGIDERTMQMLKYTQMLVQGMINGTGNGNPNATGNPRQILNAKLFNISMAFGEISSQSSINIAALQNAFRDLALSLFEDAAHAVHSDIDDDYELAQVLSEARSLGETFVDRFFIGIRSFTLQNLKDTNMTLSELSFHESWNFMYYEVGMVALGGPAVHISEDIPQHCEREFQRLMMEFLLQIARDNAEVYRQWAEMWAEINAEDAERWRKIVLIAARIAAGDNVPPEDRAFLAQASPGMYMLANITHKENDNPKEHNRVTSGEGESAGYNQMNGGSGSQNSGGVGAAISASASAGQS